METLWAGINAGIVALDVLIILYGVHLATGPRRLRAHQKTMALAGGVFVVFLASFLAKAAVFGFREAPEWGFVIQPQMLLWIHEAIAVVTVALVAMTYHAALTQNFARHRRIAPIAWRLWVFEGLFGIFHFWLLYLY